MFPGRLHTEVTGLTRINPLNLPLNELVVLPIHQTQTRKSAEA